MSMRDIPTSGYVVPVNDFKPLLSDIDIKELESLLEDAGAGEEICEFLNSCIPYIPNIIEVYYHTTEDSEASDSVLEHDNFYAIFDENELYEKTPKPSLIYLTNKKIVPKFAQWNVWG